MSAQMEIEDIEMNTEGITSTEVLGRVNALIKLQEAQEDLTAQMEKEILEIEKKYLAKFQPLAAKREEIVNGKVEPSTDDKAAKEPIAVEGLSSKPEEKGIPKFWFHVLKQTELGELISEIDEEPLSHLTDIAITQVGDDQDYSLDFHFSENKFFTNKVISKTVKINDGELETIESTPINWCEGKNFTVKTVKKQVKGKGKGKASTVTTKTVQEPVECFFGTFFSDSKEGENAEEEDDVQANSLYFQFQIIAKLKDIVIPEAVNFFLGRADDSEEGQYGDFGEFDGEDFDDDEEEEDDDEPVIRKPSGRGGKPAPPQDPNCKQQ